MTQTAQLYLVTPTLDAQNVIAAAAALAQALSQRDVACVLARIASGAVSDARDIAARMISVASPANAALLVEDPRLAARAGADGAHVVGSEARREAVRALRPQRIVGAGMLRSRDDAMEAGEDGVDYVMFGEPRADGFVPPADDTIERVAWWAEIFEPPCVGYAASLEDIADMAAAGADFVALGDAVWRDPRGPAAAMADARRMLAWSAAYAPR